MKLLRYLIISLFLALAVRAEDESPAMKPIASRDTAAWQAAKHFQRGVNMANFLEVPPGESWSVKHGVADLKAMRAEGFDHVRIPIGWHHYTGPAPDYKISDEIYSKVDFLVTNATALGLNVIINIHHFNEFTTDPTNNTAWFYAIWRQVAEHYRNAPDDVAFELINEPKDAAITVVLNPIYAQAIHEIRQTNPRRTIFVGPGKWNSPDELPNLQLPDDENIIVTLHCYDPMFFTHQGASWTADYQNITGIQFPGPPKTPFAPDPDVELKQWLQSAIQRYNTEPTDTNPSGPRAFSRKIEEAKAWSDKWGRPIHFGEFGAFTRADQASRARYYAAMRQALESAGFGWAIWDWKSGFNYWNPKTQQPLPGMHDALFPSR